MRHKHNNKTQMPAVAAAACMEYCGLELKAGAIFDARRDLDLRLRDLESAAGQLAGDHNEVIPLCFFFFVILRWIGKTKAFRLSVCLR